MGSFLGEFFSRRNGCLVMTGWIALWTVVGIAAVALIVVTGWLSCKYFLHSWIGNRAPDGTWFEPYILCGMVYWVFGVAVVAHVAIAAMIIFAIVYGIYQAVQCTASACRAAKKRAEGFEDLETI